MIQYRFTFQDGSSEEFQIDRDRAPALLSDEAASAHAWTELEFHKCMNCPLASAPGARCPAAVDLLGVAERFSKVVSYTKARIEVVTPERTYVKDADAQTGVRGLVGLMMATSGCPILSRFRGLARFHLPFATPQESLYRFVTSHLLEQHFRRQDGLEPDWELEELKTFLAEVQTVDQCFKGRLDHACQADAALNAISTLFYITFAVNDTLVCDLENLRHEIYASEKEN